MLVPHVHLFNLISNAVNLELTKHRAWVCWLPINLEFLICVVDWDYELSEGGHSKHTNVSFFFNWKEYIGVGFITANDAGTLPLDDW